MPSTSAGVTGYVLSLGTSSGSYDAAREVDIPIGSAGAGASGSLTYTIQLDRSRDQYLALRAYKPAAISVYSNEIRVAAMVASSASPSSGSAPEGSTSSLSADDSSGSLSRASASGGSAGSASALAPTEEGAGGEPDAGSAAFASLDLNGVDEYLATTLVAPIDFTSGMSASLWAKVPDDGAGRRGLLQLACADAACALELSLVRADGNAALELRVFDAASSTDDVREAPVTIASGEWWHAALVLDPASATARIYFDGELVSEETGVALPEGLLAAEHQLTLGAAEAGRAAPWLGRLGHAAVFGASLGASEVAEISLHGHELDLRADGDFYRSSSSLAHYWRLGDDADAVGLDLGPLAFDFDDPDGNVDGADVVRDGPESLAPAESVAASQ